MAENKKDIMKMAMIYTQEGKWDKAIVEYKKLITLDPTDYNIHNMLGDVYAKKGEDALAYQSYILTAEAYLKQGLSDKATIIYKKIAKLDSNKLPENDKKRQILIKKNTDAEKLIENGEIDKAIEVYKEILQINPDSFDTYQKIGELYAEKGMKEESLKYLYKVAEIYHKNRIYKKALPIYQKIVEFQPDNIEIREKIAEVYEREGYDSDAKREYIFLCEYYWGKKNIEKVEYYSQKAIETKSIEAHFFKGAALFIKKDFDEAKKEIDMLLKFKANHVEGLLLSAKINKEKGLIDQTITLLTKVIKLEEENTEAYEILGDTYLQKGLTREAYAKFLVAVNIYSKKKEFEKAEDILNKILSKEPENIEILQKLAEVLEMQNKKKQAANIYIKISEIYKKEKMESKELEFLKKAEILDPAHSAIVERAKKLSLESKTEPVKEKIDTDLKKDTKIKQQEVKIEELPPIKENIFESKKQERIKPETIKTEEFKLPDLSDKIIIEEPVETKDTIRVASVAPQQETKEDVPALLAMAEAFIKTGDFEQAIEMYQKALTLEPSNETIKSKLNKVYSQYAGVSSIDSLEKKKQEEEKRKKEEEEKRKKEEEEKRKKEEEEKRKKEEEEKRKKEEEEKRKKEEEERRNKEEKEKRKKEEEEKKKKQEEEKRKKEEEEKKKQKVEKIEEKDTSAIFSTVISAEIFIKQGLFYEAEKILNKIIIEDADNLEAKKKLDELKKLKGDGKEETDKDKKKTMGKVSYI